MIKRETCTAGKMCNNALTKKECKTPEVGDSCYPLGFSEMCYGSKKARYCDEDTNRVAEQDCNDYGNGYTCDVAENFYGPGLNVTMCFSDDEECSGLGDDSTDYCYDTVDGFRHFYEVTYTCAEFNLGFHLYNSGMTECPDNGKCGQSEIRHACY